MVRVGLAPVWKPGCAHMFIDRGFRSRPVRPAFGRTLRHNEGSADSLQEQLQAWMRGIRMMVLRW